MGKFLDKTGLSTLWAKVKEHDTATLNAAKNHTNGFFTSDAANKAIADQNGAVIHTTYIPLTQKGTANGLATLGTDGKVPTAQLPSYVDDVVEYAKRESFPSAGEAGKIYVAQDTNKTYRWSGTAYVEISASLALGEVSGTAYDGAKGKANADAISSLNGTVSNMYTNSAIDGMLAGKQNTLVSGTNLATVNGQSLLNGGNISIQVDNLDMSGYYTKTETDNAFLKQSDVITDSEINTICV